MTRAKVVFNALPLRVDGAGVSTYIRELLACLPDTLDADLAAAVQSDARSQLPPSVEVIGHPTTSGWRRTVAGKRALPPADLVHGLDVDLPLRSRVPAVSTIHDLSVFDAPGGMPRHRVVGERLLLRHAFRTADALIAVSSFTAGRVRELSGREATVILEAASPDMVPAGPEEIDRVRRAWDLPDRFVLHVGSVDPRKNVAALADACRAVGVPLVLAGALLWDVAPPGTVPLGFVPRSDLAALYGAATLVGYVSSYEGFGLPPLEAMACGAAVVSTPVPAVTELVGEAAVTVRPGDADALEHTVRTLCDDDGRRHEVATACRARVSGRSWTAVAAETAGVYRRLGLRG